MQSPDTEDWFTKLKTQRTKSLDHSTHFCYSV